MCVCSISVFCVVTTHAIKDQCSRGMLYPTVFGIFNPQVLKSGRLNSQVIHKLHYDVLIAGVPVGISHAMITCASTSQTGSTGMSKI